LDSLVDVIVVNQYVTYKVAWFPTVAYAKYLSTTGNDAACGSSLLSTVHCASLSGAVTPWLATEARVSQKFAYFKFTVVDQVRPLSCRVGLCCVWSR
jgi:hypothetical protein